MAKPSFSPLTENERAWIAERLGTVGVLVEAFSPADVGQPVTPVVLDRAWAGWLTQVDMEAPQVNGAINVFGVRFGQFLVDQVGFEWTIAADEQGTDLAVRALPGRGDVLIYPANFVAKRWQRREANFMAASLDAIREQVNAVASGQHAPPNRPWWRFWR
jgi:hypothetical protein